MSSLPPGYTKKSTTAAASAAPAGYSKAEQPKSFMQKVFDITNARTGESYLYGNKPDPSGFDDVTRIMDDTGSRGLTDWISGGAALTEAARARTPAYVEIPADLTAAVASAPYRVGSTLAGAGIGAGEGAVSSYLHQKEGEPETIARDAIIGAIAGSGGYNLAPAWNLAKSGLKKIGAWPKTNTAIFDLFSSQLPIATGVSTGSKAASALMPQLPTNAATRDLLAKSAMGLARG